MADIKNYLKEKEKREKRQQNRVDYKKKIVKHKLSTLYRILLMIAVLVALVILFIIQYKRRVYTDYDIVASIETVNSGGATNIRLDNTVLTYSKDGAHCTDIRGNVKWNQTFEIQDARVSISGNTVAIGDYNGRSIYVANTESIVQEITTNMPIRDLAVSEAGYVTAVLADTDVMWIHTYDNQGKLDKYSRVTMNNSGYPMAVSLSPNGELLCVAFVYVDSGTLKTNLAFYNLGAVGDNVSDFLVNVNVYTDMLIPYVRFVNNSTAFAVGDGRLMIYSGAHKPVTQAEHLYETEVQSVFCSDRYVGLVFIGDNGENHYKLEVFDTANPTSKPKAFYFDMDYTDIFFGNDNFVIYNATECQIITMDGIEKFYGNFSKAVNLMLPIGNGYKYLLVTEDSMDTIQLK